MLSLLAFMCLFLEGTGTMDTDVPFMEYLDTGRLVCLEWGFDNARGHITFKLVVNTTGWVGFGLSPNGGMTGSDIVIGGLGPNGSYFTDRHATGNSMPLVDEQQSYTLLSMTEEKGQTAMTFQRLIKACDDKDFHITAQPIKVIYAYGTTDEIKHHGSRRGTKEINLLNYMPKTTPSNSSYFSARVNKVTIPSIKTYYHCKIVQFPNIGAKRHVYQIEPVIENQDLVHHMLLYRCPSFVTELSESPCYSNDHHYACFAVVASWAVGGGVFEFPENVGIPVGDRQNDKYRLEIHYNNPESKAGMTDSSGLKLHYTAQLREHDVGILFTGLPPINPLFKIPPKAHLFHAYAICDTATFSQFGNAWSDLQVFGVFLHTHLTGRKVRVGHFSRNGKQIDFLALDENYQFDLQQTVSLGSIKTIQQGDQIIIECAYSTRDRVEATKLGLATTDEMCLAFLLYYPAIPIASCISYPITTERATSSSDNTSVQYPTFEDIAKYESWLKSVLQIEEISDLNFNHKVSNGTIRDLMATPTVVCTRNTCNKLCTSRRVNTAGIILLLLWIVVI